MAHSKERREILKGLINLREQLHVAGIVQGFQLLDGSFMEDVENSQQRPPNDIDVLTVFWGFPIDQQEKFARTNPELIDHDKVQEVYRTDHYFLDAEFKPETTVASSQYWYGLFSHRRDGVWKGMVRIELGTANIDRQAMELLNAEPQETVNP